MKLDRDSQNDHLLSCHNQHFVNHKMFFRPDLDLVCRVGENTMTSRPGQVALYSSTGDGDVVQSYVTQTEAD